MSFYSPIPYKIHIPNKIMRKALKSYTCEKCGCEIVLGDFYWSFKPYPRNGIWYGWRKRCLNCEPDNYDEIFYYEDHHAKTIQSKKYKTI